MEIRRRKFEGGGSDVFFQAMELGCAGNGNDPGLLRQQPGESDLRGSRLLLLSDGADQIDNRLIRFSVLRREARNDVAEIAFVELGVFADFAGEEAFAQRTEGNES